MKTPLQAAVIMFALIALPLMACGDDGPSEADMKAAFKNRTAFVLKNGPLYRGVLVSIKKKECHVMKAPDPAITKSYYCHFEATFNPPAPAPFADKGLFWVDPREGTWEVTPDY